MKKGNKPDFHDAASPDTARKLYDFFYDKMGEGYTPDRVKNGVFQAMMDVELKNDGPVGVDYCSEDAVVHFAFLALFLAAIDSILTSLISRLQSKSIQISPKRNPRSRKMETKAMNRTLRDHLNSKFLLNCCSERKKKREIDIRVMLCT
jgi:hypothetical protein